MQQQLPLPPFGRVVEAFQQESIRLDFPLYVFVGKNSKKQAYFEKRNGTLCCYLPYGDDFKAYRWPIRDQKVIIYDTGFSNALQVKKFIYHLLTIYKPRVIFLYSDSIPNEIFIPSGENYHG